MTHTWAGTTGATLAFRDRHVPRLRFQQHNLAGFIRSLVGLDRKAAKEKFAAFLDGSTYTADQMRFVNYIIEHLTANGIIEPALLYSQPYTDIHYKRLDGFSDAQANALLHVIKTVSAVVGV